MDILAATGSTVFLVILSEKNLLDFFSAAKRNAKMGSDSVTFVAPDGWSSETSPDIPIGAIGLNLFLSNSSQTQRYKALWASLSKLSLSDMFLML